MSRPKGDLKKMTVFLQLRQSPQLPHNEIVGKRYLA